MSDEMKLDRDWRARMERFTRRQIFVAKKRPVQWCLVVVLSCLTLPLAFSVALMADGLRKVAHAIGGLANRLIKGTALETTFQATWGVSHALRKLREEADDE